MFDPNADRNVEQMMTETQGTTVPERRQSHPILDGAASQPIVLPRELEVERSIASDAGAQLEERLEAFENIMDSEIGDTQLSRARNIERETGLRQLYLKFDGGNPTGTQKDRIAFAQAMDALRRGFDTVTGATCGNYAPARTEYDGFPGHSLHPLKEQIQAIELISGRPVVAITVNHEGLLPGEIDSACEAITRETGLPGFDVLRDGAGALADALRQRSHRTAAVLS